MEYLLRQCLYHNYFSIPKHKRGAIVSRLCMAHLEMRHKIYTNEGLEASLCEDAESEDVRVAHVVFGGIIDSIFSASELVAVVVIVDVSDDAHHVGEIPT